MDLSTVRIEIPEGCNIILGQSHFIKTVEDIYEIIVSTVPQMKFGIAFNEASQHRLIRHDGNDERLEDAAVEFAGSIGAGGGPPTTGGGGSLGQRPVTGGCACDVAPAGGRHAAGVVLLLALACGRRRRKS